jgi:hypothetical protein
MLDDANYEEAKGIYANKKEALKTLTTSKEFGPPDSGVKSFYL